MREIGKLTPAKVKNAKQPGLYGAGVGLYLNVGPTGGKSWVFRYMLNGRVREMGSDRGREMRVGIVVSMSALRQCKGC